MSFNADFVSQGKASIDQRVDHIVLRKGRQAIDITWDRLTKSFVLQTPNARRIVVFPVASNSIKVKA